jgi:hypothetical protein
MESALAYNLRRHRMRWASMLSFALAAGGISGAFAATFPDLYTVVVSPRADSPDRRTEGINLAMQQLLTRITGRRDAFWDPELRTLTEGPARYVDAVGFQTAEQLMVRFNQPAIEQQLVQLNRPVWSAERPLTLIWLALAGPAGERGILAAEGADVGLAAGLAETMNELRQQLRATAQERGLPITLPLLDLQDVSALDFADLWGGFTDRIVAASTRYTADAILVGRVRLGDEFGPAVQWTLLDQGRLRAVTGGGLRDGLDGLADLYAAELSAAGGITQHRVTVLDVMTIDDYGRLMRYLESLSVLETVQVEAFQAGALTMQLAARGDTAVLARMFSLGGLLRPAESAAVVAHSGSGLVLRLAAVPGGSG